MDQLLDFFLASARPLADAMFGLFWPALFFLTVGLVARKAALLGDVRRCLGETRLNIEILAFNAVFVTPIIALALRLLAQVGADARLALVGPEAWAALPDFAVVLLAVVLGDFVGYWRHRLEHTALLWPAHAVHHSDTQMTWLTLERFHPFNRLSTFLIDNGVLLLLGVPPVGLIANNLVRHYYGYFIHAGLSWTYGRLGGIFVSPAMHRWHHAADAAFFGANFATVFSIFDRMFGTWRLPGPCTAPLGVTHPMTPGFLGQIGHALRPRAYRGLFSAGATRGANAVHRPLEPLTPPG